MDFFESQEVARRNTLKLVVLFLLAIISLVAITNVLVIVTLGLTQADPASGAPLASEPAELWQRLDWRVFAWVSVAVIGVVGLGSLYKISSLSGGGARVAEMMQARLLTGDSNDPDERKVLNVVEEMAIAAGTPVPPVYVMEEEAINAFAAGYSPSDAVIGVTRGTIRKLSRDELQGVIAHEFSHILHGDMRLNIRLIGILYGIMVLGLMGYFVMRSAALSRRSRNGGQIIFLGLGLVVIGFAGTFFGNLIKSAVSRQREYLADASAVQYTRNPRGIAGALKRIGADAQGSVLENPGASEISHALFGNGVKRGFNALFATHPPLEERIQRIQPDWDGSFEAAGQPSHAQEQPAATGGGQGREATLAVLAGVAMGRIGNPGPEELAYAHKLHASLPRALMEAAHQPWAARALVYRLQLADHDSGRQLQLQHLQRNADKGVYEEVTALLQAADPEPEHRLVLVNIALSALRQLSPPQYRLFIENLAALESLDSETGLQRWALRRIVAHELDAVFGKAGRGRGRLKLADASGEITVLLSWLAHAGGRARDADMAFREAVGQLEPESGELIRLHPEALSLEELDEAMERLVRLKPLLKPRLLKACAAGIAADGVATPGEQALFRALAEIIDCPMPPLDVPSSGPAQA